MSYNPQIHHRHSSRLPNYDYTASGMYFVTICTYEKSSTFGVVNHGVMILNEFGAIAEGELLKTEMLRNDIAIPCYIVMPNHIHIILDITNDRTEAENKKAIPMRRMQCAPTHKDGTAAGRGASSSSQSVIQRNSLGMIIRGYKASVTAKINALKKTPEHLIWQRNYYDHIIKSEDELREIRKYIQNNPANWKDDNYYVI